MPAAWVDDELRQQGRQADADAGQAGRDRADGRSTAGTVAWTPPEPTLTSRSGHGRADARQLDADAAAADGDRAAPPVPAPAPPRAADASTPVPSRAPRPSSRRRSAGQPAPGSGRRRSTRGRPRWRQAGRPDRAGWRPARWRRPNRIGGDGSQLGRHAAELGQQLVDQRLGDDRHPAPELGQQRRLAGGELGQRGQRRRVVGGGEVRQEGLLPVGQVVAGRAQRRVDVGRVGGAVGDQRLRRPRCARGPGPAAPCRGPGRRGPGRTWAFWISSLTG